MKNKNILIRLNSQDKIECLLQETYNEVCRQINQSQEMINKIVESTNLADETLDNKAKFSKSVNDLLTQKNNSLRLKLEISKLMTDVLKHNGDVKSALKETEVQLDDLDSIMLELRNNMHNKKDTSQEEYNLKQKK